MKAPKKVTAILMSVLLIFAVGSMVAAQNLTVDQVEGLNTEGKVGNGTSLIFHMRINNTYEDVFSAIDNGFRFYSDGMTWGSIEGTLNPAVNWAGIFDAGMFINQSGDTVGFGGANFFNPAGGLQPGFNEVGYFIEIGPISLNTGSYLVIDSSFYAPSNHWEWTVSMGGPIKPTWGGPYTYYGGGAATVRAYLDQYPIYLKNITERTLKVYICNEDYLNVDPASVRVNGKIPTYSAEEAWIEGDTVVTDCFIFRFMSAWRPISSTVEDTFYVTYTVNGDPKSVGGDVWIITPEGDVNLDGVVDIADIDFMVKYLWGKGEPSMLEEKMDVDKNGRVSVGDLAALGRLVF